MKSAEQRPGATAGARAAAQEMPVQGRAAISARPSSTEPAADNEPASERADHSAFPGGSRGMAAADHSPNGPPLVKPEWPLDSLRGSIAAVSPAAAGRHVPTSPPADPRAT
ncbi:MAG: hypothetical protein MZV70_43155 [Desulfobacterales bacterium]|nr:hypothetical protein [Desulfobacterales bacterium]